MIIDLDKTITLATAAELLATRGERRPCLETLRRWANPKRGCRVNGVRLVLCTVRVGRDLLTTAEWVKAFDAERLRAGLRSEVPEATLPRSPSKRRQGHERATRTLEAAGIGGKRK